MSMTAQDGCQVMRIYMFFYTAMLRTLIYSPYWKANDRGRHAVYSVLCENMVNFRSMFACRNHADREMKTPIVEY